VRSTHADLTKAREVLGWVPAAQWETAVEATVRALR
jgi:hypothetical protein